MIEPAAGRADAGAPGTGLWLETLQRIAGRAAHEVKNSLNGVAVNLEVVRSRTAKAGQTTDAVARFADNAAEQFERLSAQADALLVLARAPRDPCDVAVVVRSLHALLGGILLPGAEREAVTLDGVASGATVATPGTTARILIGEALLAAIEHGVPVQVGVQEEQGGVVVVVVRSACAEGEIPPVAPAVEAIAAGDGVAMERQERALALRFPATRQA